MRGGEQDGGDPDTETRNLTNGLGQRIRQLAAELSLTDWLMVALTAVIAGSTVWNTVYVGGQLSEMRSSGTDTHNLTIATQHLADRSEEQAKAMERLRLAGEAQARSIDGLKAVTKIQADKIAGLYEAIQHSAAAADKSAAAAIAQSDAIKREADSVKGQTQAVQQSLIATREMASATRESAQAGEKGNEISNRAFLASERPWVGVDVMSSGEIKAGQDIKVTVNIRNSGRSPALRLHGGFFVEIVSPRSTIPIVSEQAEVSSATILPNGNWTYNPMKAAKDVSEGEMTKIKDGTELVVAYGRIDYSDDTGGLHTTLACALYNPVGFAWSACAGGNNAN